MTYTWLLLAATFLSRVEQAPLSPQSPVQTVKPAVYTYRVFPSGNGFGYDVIVNGKPKVHQPLIPGLSGNYPFATREDALKIATLVVKKLQAGQTLPSVSREELIKQKIKIPRT